MRYLKRATIIAAAYIAAIIAVAVVLSVIGAAAYGFRSIIDPRGLLAAGLMAGLIASPVAVPAIVFAEFEGGARWQWYALVGMTPALAMMLVLASERSLAEVFGFGLPFILAGISGALIYWLIAWKLFPPKPASVLVK